MDTCFCKLCFSDIILINMIDTDGNNPIARAYSDTYDFDMKNWRDVSNWPRNIATLIGSKVAGSGQPYKIIIYGEKKLAVLFPWQKEKQGHTPCSSFVQRSGRSSRPRTLEILAGACPSVLAPAGESLSVYSVSGEHIPAATLDYRLRSSHPFLCGADAHLRRVD